jgi:nitroreductase
MIVDDAIRSRMSTRAFTSQPVPKALLNEILELAARAPSGSNAQPWKVYVVQGASLKALVEKSVAAHDAIRANPELARQYPEPYDYYPKEWFGEYQARRRENGWGLYGLLGIAKGDRDAMHKQHQRNFRFFDAPVGLLFTLDKRMGRGSLLDYGMFMENLMLAARARGLHTCAQAAWNGFAGIVLPHVGASEDEMLICGMALGHADASAKVNEFYTPRVGVDAFVRWVE